MTFEPVDDGTAVRLVHSGWDALVDPAATRAEYEQGWPIVLGEYGTAFPVATWTYAVLLHHATIEGNVFADARFPLHVQFLRRMAEAGYLVGAGRSPMNPVPA